MSRFARRAALVVAMVALALAAGAPSAGAADGVKLLAGFEWQEYDGKLGRFVYLGRPMLESPEAGWKGERIEKLADVDERGFQIIDGAPSSSRHMPGTLCVPKHATEGRFAFHSLKFGDTALARSRTGYLERGLKEEYPPPWPVHEIGYDVHDHWFQREYQVYRQTFDKLDDWSGYDRLRFDVTAEGQPIQLGVRVRDGSGPRLNPGYTGLRTVLAVFTVPADETVTCDLPLAGMAAAAELDLGRIHRYNIRVNGLPTGKAPSGLYIDNIRLTAKGAEARPPLRLVAMDGPVRPFARPVFVKPPTVRVAEKMKRDLSPVEPLGPVVINRQALYAGQLGHGSGHFGKSNATYMSNARRAVVAYDDERLVVVMGGKPTAKGRGGGTIALASFDGGATWGGLAGEEQGFTVLPWYLRSCFSADAYGNVYAVGTPNCDSYSEGQDICLHRLAFTGRTWVDDRFAILHQDGYKCPHDCHAMALADGRIWACWGDGFGGYLARYSDDDGFTFAPCKDAALPAPRPLHSPKLADLGKPTTPPKQILLWPTPQVVGSVPTPYKGQLAVFTPDGAQWQAHDGTQWGPVQKGPKIGRLLSATTLGEDRIFLCRGTPYSDTGAQPLADLVVSRLEGDKWTTEQLEKADVDSAIVTASGEAVYCFYVRKVGDDKYEIRYRRWAGGAWSDSVKLAEEDRRINHLAAPQISPSSYAAVFWDQYFRSRDDPSEVKFVRVPNR